ncbi:MAG: biotin/lipoyl-containing protein, partial [Cycloclasticus sp.]
MSQLFKIPELGDAGISGTVVSMSVNLGDSVACGDTLLEVETDKVVLEVPAEVAGVVDSFLIEVGQAVQQGHEFVSMTPVVEQASSIAEEAAPAVEETQAAVEESLVVKDEPAAMIEPSPTPAVTNTVATTVQSGTGLNNKAVSAGPASRRLAR